MNLKLLPSNFFLTNFATIFALLICNFVIAQSQNNTVHIEISDESISDNDKILNYTLSLVNNTDNAFVGKLNFDIPEGMKLISQKDLSVNIASKDNKFVSVKLLITKQLQAGDSSIRFELKDNQNQIVSEISTNYYNKENSILQLFPVVSTIYNTNNQDSIKVKVRVSNLGNITQKFTLVYKIPSESEGNRFFETEATLKPSTDYVYTYTFRMSKNLSKLPNFDIQIIGFKSPSKEIFGYSTVSVKNTMNNHEYVDTNYSNTYTKDENSVTARMRNMGNHTTMYQISGAGGINLNNGYLYLSGSIFTLNNLQDFTLNNTMLTYKREFDEITIGNISKSLELSLYGKGVEFSHYNSTKNIKYEIGIMDQNSNNNLLEKGSLFNNGYGYFSRINFRENDNKRKYALSYIMKSEPFENSKNHILGTDFKYQLNEKWQSEGKLYAGLIQYKNESNLQPGGAAEFQYYGALKDLSIGGNYLYSTNYYPGNRRGSLQLSQNISSQFLGKHYTYLNFYASNFSPKYQFTTLEIESENINLNTGINFYKKNNWGFGLGYQILAEKLKSNSTYYNSINSNEIGYHRLKENFSWSSKNKLHSAVMTLSEGIATNSKDGELPFHFIVNSVYNYRKFNISANYQLGYSNLTEISSMRNNKMDGNYERTSISAFYNDDFFKNKLKINGGIIYNNDKIFGNAPSAFFNLKYTNDHFSAFLNTLWYNNTYRNQTTNYLSLETGITYYLEHKNLTTNKKSTLKALAFFDENNNSIFDAHEKVAKDYLININNVIFKTDEDGQISYKNLPFGTYKLKQVVQKGWYNDDAIINVKTYRHTISIPLHQNGTLKGGIEYDYDPDTALEFNHKIGGIVFNIYQNGLLIQKTMTNELGEYLSFLPTGNYTVSLNENTLAPNTSCEVSSRDIKINAGEIAELPSFIIKVKSKKINVKKFGK